MMYGTIEFDLDIDIHPRDAAILSYDPDPLSHPRYDLFQDFRMGGLGPLIGVTLPVRDACVDVLDCYVNNQRDCVTLEHIGLRTTAIARSACGCTSTATGRTGKPVRIPGVPANRISTW